MFLDDANASLRWVIAGGEAACVTYPTTAQWQAAVYSFLSNVAPQLHQAGLLVVANIGGSTITRGLWQKWNGPLDGAMEESFTNGGAGRDSIADGQWPAKLGHALWSEANGKISPRPCSDGHPRRGPLRARDDAAGRRRRELVLGLEGLFARGVVARVHNGGLVGQADWVRTACYATASTGVTSQTASFGEPARERRRAAVRLGATYSRLGPGPASQASRLERDERRRARCGHEPLRVDSSR